MMGRGSVGSALAGLGKVWIIRYSMAMRDMDGKVQSASKGRYNMETNKGVEKLVNYFMDKEYGTIIYHQEITRLIDVSYGSCVYRSIVNAAKKKLCESGRMIKSIRKTGYQVVEPDEYTDIAVGEVIAGTRRIDRASNIMQISPVKDMSQSGVERYNLVNDRLHILRAAMTGSKIEIIMLNKKRENPLKQIQA